MNYPVIDLTNCDKEPIHIMGKVQSHGYLIAADKASFTILYASNNIDSLTGLSCEELLGKELLFFIKSIEKEDGGHTLLQVIKFAVQNGMDNINPIKIKAAEKYWSLVLHLSGHCVVLELEPTTPDVDAQIQALVGSSLSRILEGSTLKQTWDLAAKQIKELIRYDRVMIYRFGEDGHGEVVAEQRNEGLEPFLGLHYPASDIPRQARELYKINLTRIIAGVDAVPADILSLPSLTNNHPLDLTHSSTRAVSAMHIEYLRNMGVKASFSVSIICNDELWGLVACHNYSPRFIDYKARQHAKLIGQVLSSSLQYRGNQEDKVTNMSYRNTADEMVRRMHMEWNLVDALVNKKKSLLKITNATGAALIFEGKTYLLGESPDEEQVMALAEWLQNNNKRNLYHTDSLPELYPPAKAYAKKASGLLACAISKELGEYILFFKPEIITMVRWAGNPDKPVELNEKETMKLSPRRSFEIWSQEVRGKSEKWSKSELNAVFKFREDIVQFINVKANEIRKLNEKLKEAYDELDTFSFTISHDLKTPLASVKNYAEMLLEDNKTIDEQGIHFLRRIVKSADKMDALIKEVLSYSRVSRQQLRKRMISMRPILEEVKAEMIAAYQPVNLQFTLSGTPDVNGDPVMITQVFSNLLGNAIKYSAKSNPAVVTVEGKEENGQVIYTIADNGIGIDMNYGGHIFELFKRMDNAKQYEGSGVGLAIVKRIMEKHNARIWYESNQGTGTVFYLSFQKD